MGRQARVDASSFIVSPPSAPERPPSLLGVTIRRAAILGKFNLGYGSAVAVLVGLSLGVASGSAFVSSFPLLLPVFGTVGSLGGIMVFTSDRMKGALEYFLAYGLSPKRLFANVVVAAIVLVSVVVGIGTAVGLGAYLARGHALTATLVEAILGYAIPMAYASAALTTMLSMYWSALSSPRSGMNSPIGLAPLIGVLPPLAVLVLAGVVGTSGRAAGVDPVEVAIAALAVVAAGAIALLALSGRLLLRERLLSSA